MNREIKFRGKRIDTGEWVYGYYAKSIEYGDNGGVEHYYRETQTEIHYILDNDGGAEIVDPSTVGQYTGLKDKNGVEIYEGDVLDSAIKLSVMFKDGMFVGQQCGRDCYYPLVEWGLDRIVIGNVSDSSELLGNI